MTHYEIVPANRIYSKNATRHVLLRNGKVEFHGDKRRAEEMLRKLAGLVWDSLGIVPVDDDGRIQIPFSMGGTVYPVGTDREDIWHDIEECFGISVTKLMFRRTQCFRKS